MKQAKLIYTALLMALFCINAHAQQGIQFSQYAFTGLTVNPAYAGYKEDWTINMVSRMQWTGIDGAPRTGAVSVDGVTGAQSKNVGLGLVITGDMLGPQTNASAYVNYAYRLRLNDEDSRRLCFGVGVGAEEYVLDYNKLNPTDPGDPNLLGSLSKLSPDCRFGLYYYSPSFYIGASALNLLSGAGFNDAAVVKQERCYYLSAGFMLPVSATVDWKPSILVKDDRKGPTNIDLTTNFLINKAFWLGASYRTGIINFDKSNLQKSLDKADAIAAIVEFYAGSNFRIGYSYDFSLTKLANYQNGTHELSLGISFGRRKERVVNPRYF